MSRSFVINLASPNVSLGLPISQGKKMELAAKKTWIGVMLALTIFFVGTYLYQVNRAASKSFVLRNLEKHLEEVQVSVAELENKSAKMQSLATVEDRLRHSGYVTVDHMEFVDVPQGYAMAN